MTSKQIYFSSPSGTSLIFSMQKKSATLPSCGMYRAEADVTRITVKRALSDLLIECLEFVERTKHIIVNVHSGPETDLDKNFSIVGKNKTSVVFNASNGVPRVVLDKLTNLPYGEVSILGLTSEMDVSTHLRTLIDLDNAVEALERSVSWAVGFGESAVVTLFARDGDVARRQVLKILEKCFPD